MAYSDPTTRADGFVVTASEWNKNTVDNPAALRTGAISVTSQAANDLVYASSASQLARIAGAASSVLVTDGSSVPSLSTTLPTAVQDNITKLGALTEALDLSNAAAGQIVFPASQNASANANTLDDYEEGTFTPTDGSGAGLSLTASGWYVKVGKHVKVWMSVTYPATANGSNASIASLPFTSGTGERWMGYVANTDLGSAVTIMGGTAATQVNVWNLSGAAQTNATLSGKAFFIVAECRASA